MGYYTSYTLCVLNGNENIISKLREENEDAMYAIDENGVSLCMAKWYKHEEALKSFSKRNPDILFKIEGEGEENGDLWVKYIKNGKVQVCYAKISFDEYDESKLK